MVVGQIQISGNQKLRLESSNLRKDVWSDRIDSIDQGSNIQDDFWISIVSVLERRSKRTIHHVSPSVFLHEGIDGCVRRVVTVPGRTVRAQERQLFLSFPSQRLWLAKCGDLVLVARYSRRKIDDWGSGSARMLWQRCRRNNLRIRAAKLGSPRSVVSSLRMPRCIDTDLF